MLKAVVKKEVALTNKELAQVLWKDGSFLENIDEIIGDMLDIEYEMDYATRCKAIDKLTNEDYVQILQSLADIMANHGMV